MTLRTIFLAVAAAAAACLPLAAQDSAAPDELAVDEAYAGPMVFVTRVLAVYPHDEQAFTQGLLWHDGSLFESTGREGQSVVREVELETGRVIRESAIPSDQFGEGLALWDDKLVSLTWLDRVIHRWDAETLEPIAARENYPLQGWGLTASQEGLIHSDGSSRLRILDPESYEVIRTIEVTMNGRPLRRLNELEMIDGLVYANIWETPYIVAIDPADGAVKRLVDLSDIVESIPITDPGAVLNGIAWDAESRRLFVTGKLWPSLFEIELIETEGRVR